MDEKDKAQAALANIPIHPGDRFQHYKGGEYEVITLAVKEDTLEPLVIYKSLAKGSTWARTLEDWNATVIVDNQPTKRFTPL